MPSSVKDRQVEGYKKPLRVVFLSGSRNGVQVTDDLFREIATFSTEEASRMLLTWPDLLEALKPLAGLADVFDNPGGTTPTRGEIYTWSRMVDGKPKDFSLTVEMLRAASAAILKAQGSTP